MLVVGVLSVLIALFALVVESKILHDCEHLLHENCTIEFRLRKDFEQGLDLYLREIINTQVFNTFKKAHGGQKLVGLLVNLGIEDVLLKNAPNRGFFLNELICYADENLFGTVDGFVILIIVIVFVIIGVLILLVFLPLRFFHLLLGTFLIRPSESSGHQILLTAFDNWAIEVVTFLGFVHLGVLVIFVATWQVLLDCFTSSWFATLWSLNFRLVLFNELNKSFVFKSVDAV